MSHNRIWSIAFLCVVFAVILAACGGAPAAAPTAGSAEAPTKSVADVPTAVSISQPTQAAPAPEPTQAAEPAAAGQTINGVTLPPDAAPPEQQVYIQHYDNTANFTTVDFFESVYNRGGAVSDILSESLVRLDKNFKVQPGAATKWEVDSSGLVWSFHLDPNLIWSDDTPVTADDYVATFR
jgi:peptide/nickel transport system substrate-binding protein/oligopeptide transport system substrate-binding protein